MRTGTAFLLASITLYGQEVCSKCHKDTAESYLRTGMARSFAPATAIPPGAYRHEASDESFTVFPRDGKSWLRREQAGLNGTPSNVVEKTIEYQFGSGNHAKSYFARDAQGGLIELPLTWYSENGGHWGMSPGYEGAQHAGFTRKINERCFFCHSSDPGETAHGIGCDRCHGPTASHAAKPDAPILNPARLTPPRQRDVCLQCHLETTNLSLPGMVPVYGKDVFSYKPGDPLASYALYFDHAPGKGFDNKFEFSSAPYRLFQSLCFRRSNDAMTCTTCHNPHKPEQDHARSLQACRSCHTSLKEHHATEDCIACHMADRRPSDAIHVSIKDHLISRAPLRSENTGAALPPYRGEVVPYYPAKPQSDSDRLYLAIAQVKNQANLKQGIPDLERAIAQSRPTTPEIYLDLADAYRHNSQSAKAIAAYRDALSRDELQWRGWHGLGLALATSDDLTGSEIALRKALALAPGEASVYESLALVQTQQGHLSTAIGTLRQGLIRMPDSPDLQNSLGTALVRAGDTAAAETALREAVLLRPELPGIRVNLATVLARRDLFPGARFEFEKAIKLDQASAATHSAFATALASHGDRADAKVQYQEALRLNPSSANSHNNLGIVLGELGDREGAIREFRAAIALDSAFPTAHYNLGSALAQAGQIETAERELTLAIKIKPDYPEAKQALHRLKRQGPTPNPKEEKR